jgi:hypothetical protein
MHDRVNHGLHAVGENLAWVRFQPIIRKPFCLPSVALQADVEAHTHGRIAALDSREQLGEQPRAIMRPAVIADGQFQVQFRRFEQQTQRPSVVHVVAYVRVEDDGDGLSTRPRIPPFVGPIERRYSGTIAFRLRVIQNALGVG